MVTWLDAASVPLSSGRLLPKPSGDLYVADAAVEDTQVLQCLITGTGANEGQAPEMIVYEHVLFGQLRSSVYNEYERMEKEMELRAAAVDPRKRGTGHPRNTERRDTDINAPKL